MESTDDIKSSQVWIDCNKTPPLCLVKRIIFFYYKNTAWAASPLRCG